MPVHGVRHVMLLLWLVCAASNAYAQPAEDATSDDLFVFRPDTPERQVRGALLAEKLDRPGLAQGYLTDLMNSQPDTEQLLELRRQFGIGLFLKLSSTKELQPVSRDLLQMINEASRQEAPAATTVALLIDELGQSPKQTLDASLKILSAESAAVVPLLAADLSTPQGQLADQLLKKYVRRFRNGLIAALPDADPSAQSRILSLLGESFDPELVPELLSYRFSESADVAAAADRAVRRLSNGANVPASANETVSELLKMAINLVALAGKPYTTETDELYDRALGNAPADEAVVYGAATLARAVTLVDAAARIDPADVNVVAVQMVAGLAEQSWPATWPDIEPLPEIAADIPQPAEHEALALQIAVETGNAAAILGLLRRADSAQSVLMHHPVTGRRCQLHPDARVRLLTAALLRSAGVQTQLIRETISTAISASEKPEAVVIDSRSGEALSVAAVVRELGYSVQARTSGQSGFDAATEQMQCELVVVHSNCLRWSLSQTIANLRADFRTKTVPILVYGPGRDRSGTETTRLGHVGVWFQEEPLAELTLGHAMKLSGMPSSLLTEAERRQMITFARGLPSPDQ